MTSKTFLPELPRPRKITPPSINFAAPLSLYCIFFAQVHEKKS
jgi:hypothetical protein